MACGFNSSIFAPNVFADYRIMNHASALGRYLSSGLHADLMINCHGENYHVHKVIVCSQSSFFAKACEGGFKEGSGVIDLEHDEPDIVRQMVNFLYTMRFNDEKEGTSDTDEVDFIYSVEINIKLYIIADKYNIGALKRVALQRVKILLAANNDLSMPAFLGHARMVYENTTDAEDHAEIRSIVAKKVVEHAQALIKDPDGDLEKLMLDLPGFGKDVTKMLLIGSVDEPRVLEQTALVYQCGICGQSFPLPLPMADFDNHCVFCGASAYSNVQASSWATMSKKQKKAMRLSCAAQGWSI
ncbi:hypothetical protein K402DRAFT_397545 [Aulographum hederae CBS 113979]|uniref:BTB domain-containing protein n=1 Tax=Aulographum hederae CBS 113979 TaxID=1176131 RepID=A0A6G1GNQ8_9PEZI|nr:hypothetical protein K402DRAFT_397545 [Aulographum hederae CBS 113979]